MKYTSKWAYLLWLPLLACIFTLCFMNVVNWNISIVVPLEEKLHRSNLHSLFLWITWTEASIRVEDGKLNILNWLIMWYNNIANVWASFVTIGWWRNNKIGFVEKSGIGWWYNNEVYASYSVIWWWSSNSAVWGSTNAIAWWQNNQTSSGWTVVGWESNIVSGRWVIVWWENNMLWGDSSMVLWNNSNWWNGSFSWNSPIVQDYSAVIMASGWVLIWTYDTITWVNLVVNGAVKIWTDTTPWRAGEIRMISGCFYGNDGLSWHLISKWTVNDECPDVTCAFGTALLKEWDMVQAYKVPYSDNCSAESVSAYCNAGWILWDGRTYYPYCYNLGSAGVQSGDAQEAKCGPADGWTFLNAPSVCNWLCDKWDPSIVETETNRYSWTCSLWASVKYCYAARVRRCDGEKPTWLWVILWSDLLSYSSAASWTPVAQGSSPGVCQWTCAAGFNQMGNGCEINYSLVGTRDNDDFLDEFFWAMNGGNPTDDDIKKALYGNNSSDRTAYTAWRTDWGWWSCNVSEMNVLRTNSLPSELLANTIYVLDAWFVEVWSDRISMSDCSAIISNTGTIIYYSNWGNVSIYYDQDDYTILDNIIIDGTTRANWTNHTTHDNGIYIVSSKNNTFNNVKVYNHDVDGIYLQNSDHQLFNNIQSFNNWQWIRLLNSQYNAINNSLFYWAFGWTNAYWNASWHGIYLHDSNNNAVNNVNCTILIGNCVVVRGVNNVFNNIRTNVINGFDGYAWPGLYWDKYYGTWQAIHTPLYWHVWAWTYNRIVKWWNEYSYSLWWSEWSFSSFRTGGSWDYIPNVKNQNGVLLFDPSVCDLESLIRKWKLSTLWYFWSISREFDNISYGKWIWTQTQPVWYNGTTLTKIWNYDSNKYIWSNVRKR